MAASITVIESSREQPLTRHLRASGLAVARTLPIEEITVVERSGHAPDLLLLDLRGQAGLPPALPQLRRRFGRMGVVLVASQLDPALMLEAMRAGVNEFVSEPFEPADLRAAVERVVGIQSHEATHGQILAFVGAKGGVGTTTLAINVAAAVAAERPGQVLMADLHVAAHGDAALLLGVEPRFSVADALENASRLDAAYLKSLVVRAKSGPDVLSSPERPALRQPDPQQMKGLIERLAAHYSCVVLDVPRADFGLLDTLGAVTAMTLVVNQELPTIRRAAQMAGMLRHRYGKDRVATVVTRYDVRADIGQEDIERVVGLPVWGVLPSDYRKAIAAANTGRPLVTDNHSRLAASVVKLAHRLAGEGEAAEARPAVKTGGRLGGLF